MGGKCHLRVVADDRAGELNDASLVRYQANPEEA